MRYLAALVLALILCSATLLLGQRFGRRNVAQNDPPPTEIVVARWRYTAMGKYGGTGWSHSSCDPMIYLAVVALLFAVTIVACFIPARRASTVDPNIAFRSE